MAQPRAGAVLSYLRRLVAAPAGDDASDRRLVARFAATRDEQAFTALVERHGAMVLGTCRRLLSDAHAADDAFQATFLVLARKAASLQERGTVAGWLYTVACHSALKARAADQRRRQREREVPPMPPSEPASDALWRDLRPILDEEVRRLPDRYRTPFVLCCLEGKTNDEAAQVLGCPTGTVLSRLSRARARLRDRLQRRGISLSIGSLTTAVTVSSASPAPAAALVRTTVQAAVLAAAGETAACAGLVGPAAALAEGVLKTMWLSKLKLAAAVMVLVVAVCGAGAGVYVAAGGAARASLAPIGPEPKEPAVAPPSKEEKDKAEKAIRALLAGTEVSAVNVLEDPELLRTFPQHLFFDVRYKYDYGVPLGRVEGSMLWTVARKDAKATYLGGARQLRLDAPTLAEFVPPNIALLKDDAALKDAVRACLRLAIETLIERPWTSVAIQDDSIKVSADKTGKTATGFAAGKGARGAEDGNGALTVTLQVNDAGKVGKVDVVNKVRPGPRPICQATKLLDADPVVRAMAAEQLLLMGASCTDYLAQRRAEAASAELRQAIDAIGGRIRAREQPVRLTPPAAEHLQHADRIVRDMARQQQRLAE